MRTAVIGASGLLGKYLMRELNDPEILGFSSREVDIRDAAQVMQVIDLARPEWVVLAAAYTDVDGCETNQGLAFDTNTRGALNVAEAAKRVGAKLLFLSSDYIFDGTNTTPYETTAPRNPRSVYGRSKAQAEIGIAEILPQACIVRTSWVFGIQGKCFPDTILQLTQTRSELEVVDDQHGSPTYARDLARAIDQLCRANAKGIVHVTNRGECTWFEFAREIVRESKLKTTVRPTTTDKFPRPAERPKYSVLSGKSLDQYSVRMPAWQDALKAYLAERESSQ